MSKTYAKIVIVGDGNVGKTSIISRFKSGTFITNYRATMGVEVCHLNLENRVVTVWDTAGQEKFLGFYDGYWIGGDLFVVVFDLTSVSSFVKAFRYIKEISRISKNIILVGNKLDCKRNVPNKVEIKYSPYVEVSAKTGENCNALFKIIDDSLDNMNIPRTKTITQEDKVHMNMVSEIVKV